MDTRRSLSRTRRPSIGDAIRRYAGLLALVVPCVAVTACQKAGGGSPIAPSGPSAPAPSALVLGPSTDFLTVGEAVTFTVRATGSNGSTQAVTAAWGSDAPAVATVDGGGTVTAVGPGRATIFADALGQRVTHLIRVVPDYAGSWTGTYVVRACSSTGPFGTGACTIAFPPGVVLPIGLELAQNGDQVSATIMLGQIVGPLNGLIQVSGTLVLAGTFDFGDNPRFTIDFPQWSTFADSDRMTMTGTFTQLVSSTAASGNVTVASELMPALARSTGVTATVQSGFSRTAAERDPGAGRWWQAWGER